MLGAFVHIFLDSLQKEKGNGVRLARCHLHHMGTTLPACALISCEVTL